MMIMSMHSVRDMLEKIEKEVNDLIVTQDVEFTPGKPEDAISKEGVLNIVGEALSELYKP